MTQFDQRYQHVETQYNADEINIHQPLLSLTEKQQRHNRVRMIERVQSIWIDEFLKSSLQELEPLMLGLRRQPDAVIHPLQPRLQEFDLSEQALLAETSIEQVYDRADEELLILGVPGAGKTCELLKLTRTLLERARQDESHPIPVVFLLSSWAKTRQPLERWLVAELHTTYQVPPLSPRQKFCSRQKGGKERNAYQRNVLFYRTKSSKGERQWTRQMYY